MKKITYKYPKCGINGNWIESTIVVKESDVEIMLRAIRNEGYVLIKVEE